MVQINNRASLNFQVKRLNEKSLIKHDATLLPTEGNNTDAQPNRIIKGGNGSKNDPFVLDGSTNKADGKYLKMVAKELGRAVYFVDSFGSSGVVTPDGQVAYD